MAATQRWVLLVSWTWQLEPSAADLYLGCPDPKVFTGSGPPGRYADLLERLLRLPLPPEDEAGGYVPDSVKLWEDMQMVLEGSAGTAEIIMRSGSSSQVYTEDVSGKLPCLPNIVGTELLEVLWVWRAQREFHEARKFLQSSLDRMAWLRNVAWQNVFAVEWGAVFAAGQEICSLVETKATFDSEEIFSQFRELYSFDYRDCCQSFAYPESREAERAPACRGAQVAARCPAAPETPAAAAASTWPHQAFLSLAMRQPSLCGVSCRFAASFAWAAQMTLARAIPASPSSPGMTVDEEWLINEAQAEMLGAEPLFRQGTLSAVDDFCSLLATFPVWYLLGRAACVKSGRPMDSKRPSFGARSPAAHSSKQAHEEAMGCSVLGGDSYVSGWPPQQRLSAAGALTAYKLMASLGGILDAFGVHWWAAHATLLGVLRNGGLLPQECDIDIALWRRDSHRLTEAKLRGALAAAGVAMYNMPKYYVFRFCAVHLAAEAEARSIDGRISCRTPYVDAHLADLVQHSKDTWHYIHRSDSRYAAAFPLAGIFKELPGLQGFKDLRLRARFGEHAEIWIPGKPTSSVYLATLYGDDWQSVLRQRDGPKDTRGHPTLGAVVHNDSTGSTFRGLFARPSGPLPDVVGELRRAGALP